MAIVKFRIRRDTAANWTAENPTLALGEPGLETDTRRVKYGDGSTAWTSLAYASEPFTAAILALAQLTPAADRLPYFTSSSAAALATLTSYARTLLDDADAATARGTLGLGSIATQASNDVFISGGTIVSLAQLSCSGPFTVVSADVTLFGLATYADDAAAGTAGLTSGDLYQTSDGAGGFFLKVKA